MKVPCLLTLAAFALASSVHADPALLRRLTGHVPRAAIARARLLGRMAPQESVSLALTLPVRDPAGLDTLLRRLYTPGDSMQGRFLTPDEFAQRFGPTAEDYAAVADFARRSGLTVTGTHPNRMVLDVAGPASAVEHGLGVRLGRYRSPQGRVFRAPDSEPSVPAALAGRLAGVVGLDTLAVRRPHLRPALGGAAGSGRGGGLTPADVRNAYGLSGGATGAGQSIALFELDGYNPADIVVYRNTYGLPQMSLLNVLIDGVSGAAGADTDEVTLDIELAQALAPNLSRILVYETPNGTDANILDGYNRIATDNLAEQVSTSWGSPESQESRALLDGENRIFQQMAAQGQSILSATGDNGAYDDGVSLSVDDPASQPYVTGVGGTTLTSGTGGAFVSERTWGDVTDTTLSTLGSGGGGGFSAVWPVPGYQAGLQTRPTGRSVPDVALNADPQTGYSIYSQGAWHVYGGTSTGAPLWAGFTALVNGQRAAAGQGPVGFLNPPLYQIGASAAYPGDFHDIRTGDNLYYPARTGYDNATGLGTFVGDALLNTLVGGLMPAPTGTVTGTVTAADTGAPLAGAAVSAVSAPGGLLAATTATGTDGAYTLAVPSGLALDLRVDAYAATGGKYGGARATANAGAGQTVTISFVLNPAHTFPAGLQMISAPYAYGAGDDLAGLFGLTPPLAAAGPRFAAWSPSQSGYQIYPSNPVNTLSAGRGYWARFPSPSYLHYDGPLVPTITPFPISLGAGWNQIGDPFPLAVPLASVTAGGVPLASSAAVSPTLYRYDTATGAYAALNPAVDSLQPYTGYWIFAYGPTALAFPPPGP
jgi:hypothetical protein